MKTLSVCYRQSIMCDSASVKKKRDAVSMMMSSFLLKSRLAGIFTYKLVGDGSGITSAVPSPTAHVHSHTIFLFQTDSAERYHRCDYFI